MIFNLLNELKKLAEEKPKEKDTTKDDVCVKEDNVEITECADEISIKEVNSYEEEITS